MGNSIDPDMDRQTIHAWPRAHAKLIAPLAWLVLPTESKDPDLVAARKASRRSIPGPGPSGFVSICTQFRFGGVRVFGQKGSWFVRDVQGVDVWKIDPTTFDFDEPLTWQDLYDNAIEWARDGMGATLFHRSLVLAPADSVTTGQIPEQLSLRASKAG